MCTLGVKQRFYENTDGKNDVRDDETGRHASNDGQNDDSDIL